MGASRYRVLTAMIFAVAMMSIDQTIVSIAAPTIQRDLALTSTGLQWVINGYLLALAALFALGGKFVWDDDGETQLAYTAPAELAARYGLDDELAARLAGIDAVTDAALGE